MTRAVRDHRQSSAARRREHARREGAVMLVVMLILMLVTASAAIAVRTTQGELQAAGQDRLALQTAYVSEAAIVTTTAWIDFLAYQNKWLDVWTAWGAQQPPALDAYGEPPINAAARHFASMTSGIDHVRSLRPGSGGEVSPLSQAGTALFDDASGVGSLGPRQAYVLPQTPTGTFAYTVDITDCFVAPGAAAAAGTPIGGGSGGLKPVRFYCVLTARGRLQLPGDEASRANQNTFRTWSFGGVDYKQDMTMSQHDSRATILTPEVLVPQP